MLERAGLAVRLWDHILQIFDLNLGQDMGSPEFLLSPSTQISAYKLDQGKATAFRIPLNSSFICDPTIRRYLCIV